MSHRQKDTTQNGETKLVAYAKATIPFFLGLVLALAFGWLVFPELLFVKKEQPIVFNHQAMLVKANMACTDCHYLRDDGSFTGLPSVTACASCHSNVIGTTENEKRFVTEYVQQGREVNWLIHQKQPDNVYFSHAAHSIDSCNSCHDFTTVELCSLCHIDVAKMDKTPPVYQNWITGYTKDTMKMNVCERCHAHPEHLGPTNASNACFVCHK